MKAYKIGAVVAEFNYEVTMLMMERAKAEAEFLGVEITKVIKVPGVFDMPLAIKKLLECDDIDHPRSGDQRGDQTRRGHHGTGRT